MSRQICISSVMAASRIPNPLGEGSSPSGYAKINIEEGIIMIKNLTPFEQTCKMIGEKYGPSMQQLLARIKERKENDKFNNSSNKNLARPTE